MQEGFRYKESEKIIPNVKKLISKFDGKIIFSCFKNKNPLFEKQLNWTKFQNEEDVKVLKELENTSPKFYHTGYTIVDKKITDFIKRNKIDKVYLCGVYTDASIIKTAMDLFDLGIDTFIIKNACASPNGDSNHKSSINSLERILGKNHVI